MNHFVSKMSNTIVQGFSLKKVLYLLSLLRTQVRLLRRKRKVSIPRAVRGLVPRSKKLVCKWQTIPEPAIHRSTLRCGQILRHFCSFLILFKMTASFGIRIAKLWLNKNKPKKIYPYTTTMIFILLKGFNKRTRVVFTQKGSLWMKCTLCSRFLFSLHRQLQGPQLRPAAQN